MSAKPFGFFVRIKEPDSRHHQEGLVHISQIRQGQKRLERPEDSGFRVGDSVYVKLLQMRGGKLSLSMKECDQTTGRAVSQQEDGRNLLKRSIAQAETLDAQGRRIGALTGVLLDDSHIKVRKGAGITRNRMPSPDMWELKQLKGG